MRAHRHEPTGVPSEFTPSESDRYRFADLDQFIQDVEEEPGPWTYDAVCHIIRVLAILAGDENVSMQNLPRVIEAFQNHGHLLSDVEVEILRDWLVALNESSLQAKQRVAI